MNPFYFLIAILAISCGGKSSQIDFGKTNVSALIADKGNPLSEEELPEVKGRVLVYPEDQKFQVEEDIVTNEFRSPKGDEINLIYWKHKFKDCPTTLKALPHKLVNHEAKEFEFKCPEKGLSVIHTQGAEKILRVREYAKE